MARKKMSDGILSKRTARDALAIISGGAAAKVDTAEVHRAAQLKEMAIAAFERDEREAKRPQRSARTEQVQYRVTEAQRIFLVREAMKRAQREGRGRIDASEVLREILDEHMERKR